MTAPVRLDVFSDYLCPWCYNAAVRLRDVQQAYGDRISVHWRTFPLIPGEQPGRRVTQKTREGWQRVGAEERRARFAPPELDTPLPASSIPALTAAKCAERQGADAFARFHDRLFTAHFGENLDISRLDALRALVRETALDLARFETDYAGEAYEAVLRDCAEGAAWFGVSSLPTVILNEKLSLVGAVPTERYRLLIDWILAGEPGGVIPLAATLGDTPAGQSSVETSAPSG
jgi:predicted DsbA family dithiol-disulfide isomerase